MYLPVVKAPHRPIRRPSGMLWIGSLHYRLGTEIDDQSGLVWPVCQLMDGRLTPAQIVTRVAAEAGVEIDEVREVVDFLMSSGWVEDAGGPPPGNLTERERARYERSVQFQSWIDTEPRGSRYDLQARIKSARVVVLGVGGIGSAVATSLVASGVGQVHCADRDVVELTNLNRQLLYTEQDLGRSKAAAAAERLRQLNSDVAVSWEELSITGQADIRAAVQGCDAFALCADRPPEIELWANDAALELGIPWVSASYTGPMLSVGTYIPGQTGCYRCLLDGEEERLAAAGLADLMDTGAIPGFNPVMAPTAQIAGHFAALETLYLIFGMNVQTAGRKFHWNYLDYEHHYYIEAKPRPGCPACHGDMRSAAVTVDAAPGACVDG